MGYSAQIQRSVSHAAGVDKPIGYVFMVAMRPRGPLRETRHEAVQDAVEAREAHVCPQYNKIFFEPLTWIAPVWP